MHNATGRSESKRNCIVGISLSQWKDTSAHHAVPQKNTESQKHVTLCKHTSDRLMSKPPCAQSAKDGLSQTAEWPGLGDA